MYFTVLSYGRPQNTAVLTTCNAGATAPASRPDPTPPAPSKCFRDFCSGRLDHVLGIPLGRLEAAQKAGYHSLTALSHEPGHTCLLFDLIWVYSHAPLQRAELGMDYSSVCPCVRPSVPLLGEAQNIWFRTILSEILENHLCIL